MKKLLAFAAMATIALAGTFALDVEASLGGAYGFSSLNTENTDLKWKKNRIDNAFGFKAEVTLGLTDNLGIQVDTAFLFPTNGTKLKTTASDGTVTEQTVDHDGSFVFNGFVGPVYKFKAGKKIDMKIGLGFDIAYNTYSDVVPASTIGSLVITPETTYITSYMSYGIGATVDATYMINKKFGIKAGLTGSYLWGNKITTTTKTDSSSTKTTEDYSANGLYLIPDISVVYKF